MSKYTTELRFICDYVLGRDSQSGYNDVDYIIEKSVPHIFSFDFPIFDTAYRTTLCIKIIKHYFTREIGEETLGLWKLRLNTKMNEIMPYYNKLYLSGIEQFNPLYDTQLTTEHKGDKSTTEDRKGTLHDEINRTNNEQHAEDATTVLKNNQSATSQQSENDVENSQRHETNQYSETPQGGLSGVINGDYLTNARIVDNNDQITADRNSYGQTQQEQESENDFSTTVTNDKTEQEARQQETSEDNKIKSTEDYVLKVYGRQGGDIAKQLMALKETLLNIDMMIINDLEILFMNVW